MSMGLYVYVGPYAECKSPGKKSWGDVIEEIESDLTCIRDENGNYEDVDIWIPNRDFEFCESFDRHADNKPFIIGETAVARNAFSSDFIDALVVLRKNYGAKNVKILYGALSYWG